jgi:hypothetical protein
MLLPYTQRVREPKDVDYQLAQMMNEPYTDMKDDINLHDQENWIEYDREALKKAKLVSGPHFWNEGGSVYVTLVFDVRVQFTERQPRKPRVVVLD